MPTLIEFFGAITQNTSIWSKVIEFLGLNNQDPRTFWFLIFIYIMAVLLIVVIIGGITSSISHICQHCNTNKTTDTDDDGNYQCQKCKDNKLIKVAKVNEKIRICPECSRDMDKQVIDGTDIVADVCLSCGGMFLDKGELKELEDQLDTGEITFNPTTSIMIMTMSH